MTHLTVGDKAPDFALKDKDGSTVSLSKKDNVYTVIYFYPKDDTPGCTIESRGFNSDLPKYRELKADIIGISGGDEETKASFCRKHGLEVILLSDPDFKIATAYGVYGEKQFMGRTFIGIHRKTFILGKDLKIVRIYDSVSPEDHSEEVLDFLQRHARGEIVPEQNAGPKVVVKDKGGKKGVKEKVKTPPLITNKPTVAPKAAEIAKVAELPKVKEPLAAKKGTPVVEKTAVSTPPKLVKPAAPVKKLEAKKPVAPPAKKAALPLVPKKAAPMKAAPKAAVQKAAPVKSKAPVKKPASKPVAKKPAPVKKPAPKKAPPSAKKKVAPKKKR